MSGQQASSPAEERQRSINNNNDDDLHRRERNGITAESMNSYEEYCCNNNIDRSSTRKAAIKTKKKTKKKSTSVERVRETEACVSHEESTSDDDDSTSSEESVIRSSNTKEDALHRRQKKTKSKSSRKSSRSLVGGGERESSSSDHYHERYDKLMEKFVLVKQENSSLKKDVHILIDNSSQLTHRHQHDIQKLTDELEDAKLSQGSYKDERDQWKSKYKLLEQQFNELSTKYRKTKIVYHDLRTSSIKKEEQFHHDYNRLEQENAQLRSHVTALTMRFEQQQQMQLLQQQQQQQIHLQQAQAQAAAAAGAATASSPATSTTPKSSSSKTSSSKRSLLSNSSSKGGEGSKGSTTKKSGLSYSNKSGKDWKQEYYYEKKYRELKQEHLELQRRTKEGRSSTTVLSEDSASAGAGHLNDSINSNSVVRFSESDCMTYNQGGGNISHRSSFNTDTPSSVSALLETPPPPPKTFKSPELQQQQQQQLKRDYGCGGFSKHNKSSKWAVISAAATTLAAPKPQRVLASNHCESNMEKLHLSTLTDETLLTTSMTSNSLSLNDII